MTERHVSDDDAYCPLMNHVGIGVYRSGPEGRFTAVNAALVQILGYASSAELLQVDLLQDIFESAEVGARLIRAHGGDVIHGEDVQWRRKDGRVITVRLSGRAAPAANGDTGAFEMVVQDITAQQEVETQLRQAQKLEAIGQLAAGIAHEINTPTQYVADNIVFLKKVAGPMVEALRTIQQSVDRLESTAQSADIVQEIKEALNAARVEFVAAELPDALREAEEGLQRVSQIVTAMKEFSHPGTSDRVAMDLNRVIENTVMVCRNEWKYVAELELELDASLPPVAGYAQEINQVVLNLVVNAAHALADARGSMPEEKGVIVVSTRPDGDWVELVVSDNGPGIPPDIRQRIFEPFFTTKDVGKGTGQGLAIARSAVVDKHGGTLSVESDVGEGTRFVVRLPGSAAAGILSPTDTVKHHG